MELTLYKTPDGMASKSIFATGEVKTYTLDQSCTQEDMALASAMVHGKRVCDVSGDMPAGYTTTADSAVYPAGTFTRTATEPTEWWCLHICPKITNKKAYAYVLDLGETFIVRQGEGVFVFAGAVDKVVSLTFARITSDTVTLTAIQDNTFVFITREVV